MLQLYTTILCINVINTMDYIQGAQCSNFTIQISSACFINKNKNKISYSKQPRNATNKLYYNQNFYQRNFKRERLLGFISI